MGAIADADVTLHVLALVIGFPVISACLSFLRVAYGHGFARVLAAIALFLSLIPLIIILSELHPDSLGLRYVLALEALSQRIGWAAFVVPVSLPLTLSAFGRHHGGRWIDLVHLCVLLGLVGLWLGGI